MYTLDTNAIIYYLAGEDLATDLINTELADGAMLYVPTVVRLELLSKSDILTSECKAILSFLSLCRSIPLDDDIADIASDMRRLYGIKTPDSIVAATTLFTGSELLTRDVKDFQRVTEVRVRSV